MGYVTPEQIAQAKEWDLLTYLQRYDPHQLVHVGGSTYCTREHDSLKISNGKWNWFSRKIGGKTALDYLIKVQGFSFTQAVEALAGPNLSHPPPAVQAGLKEQGPRKLVLPQASRCATHIVSYLHGRGIDYDVIDYCIQTGRLYESLPYHNAVFVGRDQTGQPRYAALRGIVGDFKGEAPGSDKRYAFAIAEKPDVPSVHLFESAIDSPAAPVRYDADRCSLCLRLFRSKVSEPKLSEKSRDVAPAVAAGKPPGSESGAVRGGPAYSAAHPDA